MSATARHPLGVARFAPAWAGILVLVLLVSAPNVRPPEGEGPNTGVYLTVSPDFIIRGNVPKPLSPGVMVPLDLQLVNSHDRPLLVRLLTVRVRLVHAPDADESHPCSAGDFAVRQASSSLTVTVPARSARRLSTLGVSSARRPQVGMVDRPVNQDGCKGSTVALTYQAAGRLIT